MADGKVIADVATTLLLEVLQSSRYPKHPTIQKQTTGVTLIGPDKADHVLVEPKWREDAPAASSKRWPRRQTGERFRGIVGGT